MLHAQDHRAHLVLGVLLAHVVASCELRHVTIQMLRTHLVERPYMAALQHRPERLYTVRVNLLADILTLMPWFTLSCP